MNVYDNEINYQDLEIDKANIEVNYNDKLHKYWVKNTCQTCISVTTLIHTFSTFDEDFWSSYKALESLVSPEVFNEIKPSLLDSKKFRTKYLEIVNVDECNFNERKLEILAEWAMKREESCVRGSAIHKDKELSLLAGNTKEITHLGLGGTFTPITTNKMEFGLQRVYPELLLSRVSPDGKLRIAGQADLVIIDGDEVYILDYKTSKKIEQKSFFDKKKRSSQKMKYPLNNLDDTNFWHYTLQLSTYAWMIEKSNPKFKIKQLTIIHYDHDGGVTYYDCEYLKNDVERMLAYYKKQAEYEEFKKSHERMVI